MAVDMVASPSLHLPGDLGEPGVVELHGPAAVRADDVVVMGGFTGHIGVLTGGQVQAFHESQVREQLERAEDRGAPDCGAALRGVIDQLARRELTVPGGDELRHGAPWFRVSDAGSGQDFEQRLGFDHVVMILSLITIVNPEATFGAGPPWPRTSRG